MGVTIHYRMGQKRENVQSVLDRAQKFAEKIRDGQASKTQTGFIITRVHPYRLQVDIGNCESLCFGFGGMEHWDKRNAGGFNYEREVLQQVFKDSVLEQDKMWCAAFCKTQFANSPVEHMWVADIVRMVAAYCEYANVYDEGDYYHTGKLEDATNAIAENGKMIAGLGKMLNETFGAENVVMGGETKIEATGARCSAPWCKKPAINGLFCADHGQTDNNQSHA